MFSAKNTSYVFRNKPPDSPGSQEYRAELLSRMTSVRKPDSPKFVIPDYAKIDKSDNRSHHCAECDKLHFEIQRLQMQLEERSSIGTRLAVMDSREANRTGEYRQNSAWKASWAATPDMISTHSKGDGPQQKRQNKDIEEEVKRLKRELHRKNLEVKTLREAKSRGSMRSAVLPPDAIVDPLPVERVSELYIEVYQNDWVAANQVLLNDKVKQEQAASKLIGVLTDAFAYCENLAPEHLQTIINSSLTVKPRTNITIPRGNADEQADIQKQAGIFRKNVAEQTAMSIIKNFRFEVFMKKKDFTSKQKQDYAITKYVDKCVNIAWFIAIQSYPIVLDDSVSRDKAFKYDTYQPFDDDGEEAAAVYDYLIWPALLNAENNSLLCQGVALRKIDT